MPIPIFVDWAPGDPPLRLEGVLHIEAEEPYVEVLSHPGEASAEAYAEVCLHSVVAGVAQSDDTTALFQAQADLGGGGIGEIELSEIEQPQDTEVV